MEKNNNLDLKYRVYGFFFMLIMILVLYFWLFGSSNNTTTDKKEPDNIEIMTYAQEVLKDNLYNPKYSSHKEDYNIIGTGLRYKIEGKVNNEKFWMIIQFTDDTYKKYDLISLQVGTDIIYKQ